MGNTLDPRVPTGLYRLRGPLENRNPHLARRLAAATSAGVLGLVGRGHGGFFREGFPDNSFPVDIIGENLLGDGGISGLGRLTWPPGVSVGSLTIRGSLDGSVVRRIIRRHLNEVKYCFQNVLQGHPYLAGETTVRFVVLGTGRVERASRLGSSLHNEAVERCLVHAARRWLYPQGQGITVVQVPFRFR